MQAVVMAGGEGSRLRPLTINRPKPMVAIVNKPCLGHIFDLLKRHDIDDAFVTLQYLASVIQDAYGDGGAIGMRLRYSVEETPLGTGGSVRQIGAALDDTFLVISGDAMTDIDLSAVVAFHKERKAAVTLTLVRVANPLEYGVVITQPDGRITKFLEKPSWGEVFSDTINTGIYVIEPRVLERYAIGENFDFSKDLFPQLLADGEPLYGYVADGYWTDVGSIAEYGRANADLLLGKMKGEPLGIEILPGVFAGGEVEIEPSATLVGPIFLGAGVRIGGGAEIVGPTVLRDSVTVDQFAHVEGSIVWRNSYIGERSDLRGTIVGRQCALKSRVTLEEGSVVGDHSVINEGARVRADVKIWPDKQVEGGAVVASSLIWGSQGRRSLFGRFGVTGLVNVDLTAEFAARLGSAYASSIKSGAIVTMNRDQHRSSRMLKRALMGGIVGAGVDVADLTQAPLPIGRFQTRRMGAAGGVHVRVSPFDVRVCDIKFFDRQALDMDKAQERKVENTFFREDFRRSSYDDVGRIIEIPRVGEEYSEAFLREVSHKREISDGKFKIVLNYSHGTAAQYLPQLMEALDIEVIGINSVVSENIGSRSLEEFQQQMRELAAITATLRASFGVTLDSGGEKVFFTDDRGRIIEDRHFLTAFIRLVAKTTPGLVAVPVFAPAVIERLVAEAGGRVQRVRASAEAQMGLAAREHPLLVADGLGGFIFPRFHPSFDGLFAIVKLLEQLAVQETTLAELMDGTPAAHLVRLKVDCPWEDKGRVMRMLAQDPATDRTKQVDGVKHVSDGEWVLVLPDADQPLFNVWAEAGDDGRAWSLAHQYADRVGSFPGPVKIAIAQCAPALGAMKRNLEMHREWIGRARATGAKLVVFPELSLTGYYLKDLAADVGCAADDPILSPIAEASRDIDVSAGFVERSKDAKLHIAQGYWSGGKLRHVHRKVYLPTYGIFDDGRYFGPGDTFVTFESAAGVAGMAICEDLWHLSVPYLYAVGGASVVFAPAASPGRGVAEGGDLGTAASCRMMDRFYAQYLTVYVVFVNRVGHEDGIGFWGGSEVIAPDGTIAARAKEFEEELLVAELDTELVARERARNPLLRDERPDLVFRVLAERVGVRVTE